ncbi:MAG: hypothetical protein V1725_02140 [archaeon]
MLYIHTLKDFNVRSADIEATPLIRELKQKTPPPFSEEQLWRQFAPYFVSASDREMMANALKMLGPVMQDVRTLIALNSPTYEAINLQRALAMLDELPRPLTNNLVFAEEIAQWQDGFNKEAATILNGIPAARTEGEKKELDLRLNGIFQKLLRHEEFSFNYQDIIHEGPLNRIGDLHESLSTGFLFHVTLQEHLSKQTFNIIKGRIPVHELQPVEKITNDVLSIQQGIRRAYEGNMRMIEWALLLYAYVKWMLNK